MQIDMEAPQSPTGDLQAVQFHLTTLQSVIQRMANNSASTKSWCITIVSAILVIIVDKGIPQYTYLAFIPVLLFCALDAYYLGLERRFISSYNTFVKKQHIGNLHPKDYFVIKPQGNTCRAFFTSLFCSVSVWLFYLTIAGMICAIKWLVI